MHSYTLQHKREMLNKYSPMWVWNNLRKIELNKNQVVFKEQQILTQSKQLRVGSG